MIAVDWGTSSFRAYRLSPEGVTLERREAPLGITQVRDGNFAGVLESQVGGWLAAGEPVVMSGMIGSRHGWLEVPYVACPAGLAEIAASVRDVCWGSRKAWVVPGLSCRDADGVPDVMRGEETQVLGAVGQLPADAQICLPGTHSKWVRVRDGRITGFATYLTGELYAVLKDHSLLGRTMENAPTDLAAFSAGVERARNAGGLLHHLFGVRARTLFAEVSGAEAPSYLSGILVGHELGSVPERLDPVFLLGAASLGDLYARALRLFGREGVVLDSDSVAGGLFAIGRHLRAA